VFSELKGGTPFPLAPRPPRSKESRDSVVVRCFSRTRQRQPRSHPKEREWSSSRSVLPFALPIPDQAPDLVQLHGDIKERKHDPTGVEGDHVGFVEILWEPGVEKP
jgi:hypothetical protein